LEVVGYEVGEGEQGGDDLRDAANFFLTEKKNEKKKEKEKRLEGNKHRKRESQERSG
jgi:hypothetical protein